LQGDKGVGSDKRDCSDTKKNTKGDVGGQPYPWRQALIRVYKEGLSRRKDLGCRDRAGHCPSTLITEGTPGLGDDNGEAVGSCLMAGAGYRARGDGRDPSQGQMICHPRRRDDQQTGLGREKARRRHREENGGRIVRDKSRGGKIRK